jgi:hypothetical protein
METTNLYPFARELITDADGDIKKVVLDIADYQALIGSMSPLQVSIYTHRQKP